MNEAEELEIIIRLDRVMSDRKISVNELAERIDVHPNNLSIFKNGRGQVIKIKTLMRLCSVLKCTPNDIFEFRAITPAEEMPAIPYTYYGSKETGTTAAPGNPE